MKPDIQIIEKPDWVSWDDIHEVLWQAHAENRMKGINMAFPTLPGVQIEEKIKSEDGKMYVAILNDKIIGTGAILIKNNSFWWNYQDKYAYCCFDSVLLEYSGHGVYKQIELKQEEETVANGVKLIMFDTHEKNERMLLINKKNGFKAVDIKICKDHYNIVMVKWLEGCPYSDWYIRRQFLLRKWYRKLRYKPGGIKRFGI